MRIAVAIDSVKDRTNGSVMTALQLCEGLRRRGNEVTLMAVGAEGEGGVCFPERRVPVLSEVAAKNQIRFAAFDGARAAECLSRADVVHLIFPFRFERRIKALADRMGVPSTAGFHVQPENVSYNAGLGGSKAFCEATYAYFRTFYDRFDRVHCPSAFIAGELENHGYRAKTYVASNGYDPVFRPGKGSPHEKFEVVMTGRLAPEKRQDVIVEAVARCRHRDDVHLTLFGNGPERGKLERQAERLGVDLEIGFLPHAELAERLHSSDLYVHSATVEIEAIACLEATACGLVPVISDSPLSATKQFALDDRSLFSDGDPGCLAERIDYWYEHPAERESAGKLYARHAEGYSLERSCAILEGMMRDEIEETRARRANRGLRPLTV